MTCGLAKTVLLARNQLTLRLCVEFSDLLSVRMRFCVVQ